MIPHMNPAAVSCMPGKLIVEITEVLGEMRNGIWYPAQDHHRKDTAYGVVVDLGGPPRLQHVRDGGMLRAETEEAKEPWPDGHLGVEIGDVVLFPRDVEMAFIWEDHRYAILHQHELILATNDEEIRVVPWER